MPPLSWSTAPQTTRLARTHIALNPMTHARLGLDRPWLTFVGFV